MFADRFTRVPVCSPPPPPSSFPGVRCFRVSCAALGKYVITYVPATRRRRWTPPPQLDDQVPGHHHQGGDQQGRPPTNCRWGTGKTMHRAVETCHLHSSGFHACPLSYVTQTGCVPDFLFPASAWYATTLFSLVLMGRVLQCPPWGGSERARSCLRSMVVFSQTPSERATWFIKELESQRA
jgi:hypothetical protein